MGERLAVGHGTLRPRREQVRRQLGHACRPAKLVGRAAEQVEAVDVVLLDRRPGRRGRRRGARGRAGRATRRARVGDLVERGEERFSGSAVRAEPPMCGVIVGSTWSPEIITRSAGSNRQRWSAVWPGVWIATHSRPARRSPRRRRRGRSAGVPNTAGTWQARRIRIRRLNGNWGPRRPTAAGPTGAGARCSAASSTSRSGGSARSHNIRKRRWVTMSAPVSSRTRPAPPKWSGWL